MTKVLHNFTLIDGTGRAPVSDAIMVIEDGNIQTVGSEERVARSTKSAEWRDLDGAWVIPGLIDCHVHLAMTGAPSSRLEGERGYTAVLMLHHAQISLEAGFTCLRDLGGRHYLELGVRRAIQEGKFTGPRLFLAGKVLSITSAGTEYFDGMYHQADGPDEVRKAAREQFKAGADLLKVMASGAVLAPGEEPGWPQYGIEEIRVAVEEAEKSNKTVAAHAHGVKGIRNAVKAGVQTIEHGTYLEEDAELAAQMAKEGIFIVPTLMSLYGLLSHGGEGVPTWALEKGRRNHEIHARSMLRAREAGVPIAMGTDAGTPYNFHGENAKELLLMEEIGFSPMETIMAATRNAAHALGLEDVLGTLEAGKWADFLILRGNPLGDLRVLIQKENIQAVFVEGRQVVPDMQTPTNQGVLER